MHSWYKSALCKRASPSIFVANVKKILFTHRIFCMFLSFSNIFSCFDVATSFCIFARVLWAWWSGTITFSEKSFPDLERNLTRCHICKFIFHQVTYMPLNKVCKMGDWEWEKELLVWFFFVWFLLVLINTVIPNYFCERNIMLLKIIYFFKIKAWIIPYISFSVEITWISSPTFRKE